MKDNWKLDREYYHIARRNFHEAERNWKHFAKSTGEDQSKKAECELDKSDYDILKACERNDRIKKMCLKG